MRSPLSLLFSTLNNRSSLSRSSYDVLQTLHQLHCPSLDTLESFNVLFVVRGPKQNTVIKVQPHQCRAQGSDPFPVPAGHAMADTSQDAIGLLGHLGTLLAPVQLAGNHPPRSLSDWLWMSEDVPEDEKSEAWGSPAAPSRMASVGESSSWVAATPTQPRGQ